ncbi:MAG: hypothetical protein AAFN70_09415 [Planctomycetota bacterium]
MPISGSNLHAQLGTAYQHATAELKRLRGLDTAGEVRQQTLREDRTSSLDRLARHYLPQLSQEAINAPALAETWREVRGEIQSVLDDKFAQQAALQEQQDALQMRLDQAQQRLQHARQQTLRDGLQELFL